MRSRLLYTTLVLALTGCSVVLAGCTGPTTSEPMDNDFPLSDVDPLYEDAPFDNGRELPFDSKADEVIPDTFDLMDIQSPVQSQGSRGTCTIFATVALMESLYIAEGTITDPDFSEQFLQWSAKIEVGSFPNSSGSNPQYNLQAINRHGIVEEALWPYETQEWGTSDDPACTGDSRPVRCRTNGDPPAEALAAQRYTLPRGRWINPRPESLMGHMMSTRTPVVVSGDFFYQSWNHGRSNLTTNSDYSAEGYVLAPNAEDITDSSGDRRAGHGFLLLGWDKNLSVPRVDAEGNETGEMETGFFLFKNSWGTGRFGTRNPHGAGYGWISFRYVEEYLTAYVAELPTVSVAEVCNDGRDNDRNGAVDCADAACASDRSCMDPGDMYENTTQVAIPDNSPTGASTTITVADGGTISSVAVTVDVTHTYRGDLTLRLVRDDGVSATLIDRAGGSADDIQDTFTVSDFNGTDAAGTYTLEVVDSGAADTGTLNSWRIDITRCDADCGGTSTTHDYEDTTATPLPDESTTTRTLEVDAAGEITEMRVDVDIAHTYPSDLQIRIQQAGGREIVLFNNESGDTGGIHRMFNVPGFVGTQAAGTYTLTIVDMASGDEGTLEGWSIHLATR